MGVTTAPLVIAHRGASGYRPEHTRAAFELAIALGADAVEPDLVPTKDGVLVVRHENEISGTTDVANHPEFRDRRTTKTIDGVVLTGWFTEDFTWAELSTLRACERLPKIRQANSTFDGASPLLRLSDLRELVAAASRPPIIVAELKHATYFESVGLALDELFAAEAGPWATDHNLVVESFERTVLMKTRERGMPGRLIYLIEDGGSPADLVESQGTEAPSYADEVSTTALEKLAGVVDGVSVDKSLILDSSSREPKVTDIVDRVHAAGLLAFCWTLRPENSFLSPAFRRGARRRDWGDWRGEYELVLGSGVDGVFADHPDLALAVRDAVIA